MRAGTAGSLSPASRSFASRRASATPRSRRSAGRVRSSQSRSSERRCSPRRSRSHSPRARSRKRGRHASSCASSRRSTRARCWTRSSRTREGAVALAEADAPSALASLRQAQRIWLELDAPYEVARTRELIAQACSPSATTRQAALELEAARELFERLGAAPDLARISPRGRRDPRAVGARARGPAPRRLGEEQPRDRVDARHQRAHRGEAPAEHLREARRLLARRRDGLRLRARARVTPPRGQK